MAYKARRILLFALLGASALPFLLGDKLVMPFGQRVSPTVLESHRDEEPKEGAAKVSAMASSVPMLLEIRPRTAAAPPGDAFKVPHRETQPEIPVVRRVETQRPVAPPLPFVYLGKKIEDGSWLVFLGRGELVYILKEGDVLENIYRVEAIRPPTMTLSYAPLGQMQILAIGDAP